MATPFSVVYDSFLAKVTDDMYMELFPEETMDLLEEILVAAIPWFEFPRVDVSDYDLIGQTFNVDVSSEEANIVATYMVVEWMGQQLASVQNTRMMYSGSDFKFTSQANHMAKILAIKDSYEKKGHHLQRLYKRRDKNSDGAIVSTMAQIMEVD